MAGYLLGLAISYIQKRYSLVDPDFASLKFEKKDFTRYMLESSQTKTENIIVSYLVGIASEVYGILSVTMVCLSYRWPY